MLLKTSCKNTSSPSNQTTVVTVACKSNTVPRYLREQEPMQSGWKSFTCYCFAKFLWKVSSGKWSIIAKTVERMILTTSLCHRPCFSKVWVTQRLNIHAWKFSLERKGRLQLIFQRMCKESSTRHSEGGFSESYIDAIPNLDMLIKVHDRRPKAFQAIVEFATDGVSFLQAVHQRESSHQQPRWNLIASSPVRRGMCLLRFMKKGRLG